LKTNDQARRAIPPREELPEPDYEEDAPGPRQRQPQHFTEDEDFEDELGDEEDEQARRRRRRRASIDKARSRLLAPAIALLVTALLCLIINPICILINLSQPLPNPPPPPPGANPEGFRAGFKFGFYIWTIAGAPCTVAALVVMIGSIQMLRVRMRGLAVTASVLAMLLVWPGCCLLGLPFGIWSMIVLNQPEVRRAFR
jgi:hypothetical protein